MIKLLLAILIFLFVNNAQAQSMILGIQSNSVNLPPTLRQRWQPTAGNILLTPTLSWEGQALCESTLMNDSGIIRLYYTGLPSDQQDMIGLATTTDMSTAFTKSSTPVIGWGYGGAPSTRNAQGGIALKHGGYYYYFATDGYGNGAGQSRNVYLYRSSNGSSFTDLGMVVNKTSFSGIAGFGNTAILLNIDGSPTLIGGKYHMVIEAMSSVNSIWEMYHAEAPAITGPWTITQKLPSLEVVPGNMYGGACVRYYNGVWHIFYHYGAGGGNLPTYLAYAQSTNGLNWTIKEAPFMTIEAQPYGTATDQVADAWVTEIGGKTYLVGEYCANGAVFKSQLRLWSFNGTFAQLVSGL